MSIIWKDGRLVKEETQHTPVTRDIILNSQNKIIEAIKQLGDQLETVKADLVEFDALANAGDPTPSAPPADPSPAATPADLGAVAPGATPTPEPSTATPVDPLNAAPVIPPTDPTAIPSQS